jgi:hypothetical protein
MSCLYSSPELIALRIPWEVMTRCTVAPQMAPAHIERAMRLHVSKVQALTLSSTFASSKHAFPIRLRRSQRIPHSACRNRPGFRA